MYSGPLLHSGSFSDYTPLGEVGYPVYSAAPQIRLAVARQIGQDAADFLAVPKHHLEGKSIDWYAPVSGDIVPWSAASPEERAQLIGQIEQFRARIAEHAQKIRASAAEGDQRVFGLLLEQATRIPDETNLFLVGNKPVITFWGFVKAGDDRRRDVLGQLRGTAPSVGVSRAAESARFGWRWSDHALRLFAYVYNEGSAIYRELSTVNIGELINCSIRVSGAAYLFTVDGQTTALPRASTPARATGYQLYPYFGGDESSPHEINIWIKTVKN